MNNKQNIIYKISLLVVGIEGVGKRFLVNSLSEIQSSNQLRRENNRVFVDNVNINGIYNISYEIAIISGMEEIEKFSFSRKKPDLTYDIIFFVFDMNKPESLSQLPHFIQYADAIHDSKKPEIRALCANKNGIRENIINQKTINEFMKQFPVDMFFKTTEFDKSYFHEAIFQSLEKLIQKTIINQEYSLEGVLNGLRTKSDDIHKNGNLLFSFFDNLLKRNEKNS